MKITIEVYKDKFTYESEHDSMGMDELTEKLYGLCIAAGYHPDTVGECFYDKGQEATEHLYSEDSVDHDDDNSMIDWMKEEEEDVHSDEPEVVTVKSLYGDERKFTTIDNNCIEYSFEDAGHVRCIRNDDGDTVTVDPSGGPYIAVGTNLGHMHKDLDGLIVTKIKRSYYRSGSYYLTVKNHEYKNSNVG